MVEQIELERRQLPDRWVITGEAAVLLSRRWLSGVRMRALAREYGIPVADIETALRKGLTGG